MYIYLFIYLLGIIVISRNKYTWPKNRLLFFSLALTMLEPMALIPMFNALTIDHSLQKTSISNQKKDGRRGIGRITQKRCGWNEWANAGTYGSHSHVRCTDHRTFTPENPDLLQKTPISNRRKGRRRGIGRITRKRRGGNEKGPALELMDLAPIFNMLTIDHLLWENLNLE